MSVSDASEPMVKCVAYKISVALLTIQLLWLSAASLCAQTPEAKEYQVKALFLYNFTQFVEWPSESFSKPESPLVIGILGDDPFGSYINEVVNAESIDNHPIVVERYRGLDEVSNCHILYINLREKDAIRRTLDSLKFKPVLTVSDAENFAKMGGIIQFVRDEARIRLRINTTAVTQTPLVMSSKLLRVSEIITTKNN